MIKLEPATLHKCKQQGPLADVTFSVCPNGCCCFIRIGEDKLNVTVCLMDSPVAI